MWLRAALVTSLLVLLAARDGWAQASIVPVSRFLSAHAAVPPNFHNPPNVVADPDPGGPLSHVAQVLGNPQHSTARIFTNILPGAMEFSADINASNGSAQASGEVFTRTQISLTSDSVFRLESEWGFFGGGPSMIEVRDGAEIHVFSHWAFGGAPETTLSLPAGLYNIRFRSNMPNPGQIMGGYTFTQIPEPAGAAVTGAGALALLRAGRRRR